MKLREILKNIESINSAAHAPPIYVCGGIPRDKILNKLNDINDLDLTNGDSSINLVAKETALFLRKYYTLEEKTMSDGHVSIFLGNLKLDFSSNFVVDNIDLYLSELNIKNPNNMQKELFSRDFTCNALLMKLDLKTILDPIGRGLKDIKEKKIKTCLKPEITFTTNKNRVIRAIYLAAKLDFDLDEEIIEWVSKNPQSIQNATQHTLIEKLNKSIKYNPDKTVLLLNKMNLWQYIPISKELYPYYKNAQK